MRVSTFVRNNYDKLVQILIESNSRRDELWEAR